MTSPALALKLPQLRLICAVAEHGKLQSAAEACAMSQPAASRMLAEVERRLDAVLFDRQPTGMVATEIGRAVLRRARAILREVEHVGTDVAALRSGLAGAVRVGAVTGPAVSYLVAAVRDVKALAPDADITVEVLPSRELLQHLAAGELDFAMGRILPEFANADLAIIPLRDERVSFLVRAGHPLARAGQVTLMQLSDMEWVMQQRGSPIREATLAAFASVGLPEPVNIINTPSLLFTIAYLAQGNTVAPMSDEVTDLLIQPPIAAGLARLRVQRELWVSPYYLLSQRRRPMTPLAQKLRDAVLTRATRSDMKAWSEVLR